jgi:hypothetical protein
MVLYGMVLVWYFYGIGIGICGTLSHIHVRIRDEEYSLVWSKNPILR